MLFLHFLLVSGEQALSKEPLFIKQCDLYCLSFNSFVNTVYVGVFFFFVYSAVVAIQPQEKNNKEQVGYRLNGYWVL